MNLNKGKFTHLLEINLAVILISTSGPLGRYIQLSPPLTIGARAVLAFFMLWGYCKVKNISLKIDKKDRIPIVLSGALMGGHWVTYFYSLQLSSVAIGMLSIYTYPIITALLEPVLLKTGFQRIHVFLGLLVISGIYFLVPSFTLENTSTIAVALGVLSAFLYSIRNIILKTKVSDYNGSSLMCIQVLVVSVLLFPWFFSNEIETVPSQLPWIIALALLTTSLGHTLFLACFRYFSITTVSILSSVQPIYGIIWGALFLSEIPTWATVTGGTLILLAVIIESVRIK